MAREQKRRPELDKSPIVDELPVACSSEAAAVEFLEAKRWGDKPTCPHCQSANVYTISDRKTGERSTRWLWRCRDCGKQYTVRTGTIYAESLIPLHKWVRAFWEAASCKNGISAMELSRKLQVSYRSALFMAHRIRHAMVPHPENTPKLSGTVEIDETYWGGRRKVTYRDKRGHLRTDWKRMHSNKTPIIAAVQRGGPVRTRVVGRADGPALKAAVVDFIEHGSRVMTDDNKSYRTGVQPIEGTLGVVRHSMGEYVRGDISTNSVESFFSRVKKTLHGTHHAVSREHLHRYIAHVAYLHNFRHLNDGQRTVHLIGETVGKRLRMDEDRTE